MPSSCPAFGLGAAPSSVPAPWLRGTWSRERLSLASQPDREGTVSGVNSERLGGRIFERVRDNVLVKSVRRKIRHAFWHGALAPIGALHDLMRPSIGKFLKKPF